jgi:hypothetical protein
MMIRGKLLALRLSGADKGSDRSGLICNHCATLTC